MIVETKSDSIIKVDTGTMVFSVGNRCSICNKKTQTVRVADVYVCSSCLYILATERIRKSKEHRVRKTISIVNKILGHINNTTLVRILGAVSKSRVGIRMLSAVLHVR